MVCGARRWVHRWVQPQIGPDRQVVAGLPRGFIVENAAIQHIDAARQGKAVIAQPGKQRRPAGAGGDHAQRLERFVGIVGADRVIASTDCGFGTFAGYGKIDPLVTAKKLKAMREGADIAAARL